MKQPIVLGTVLRDSLSIRAIAGALNHSFDEKSSMDQFFSAEIWLLVLKIVLTPGLSLKNKSYLGHKISLTQCVGMLLWNINHIIFKKTTAALFRVALDLDCTIFLIFHLRHDYFRIFDIPQGLFLKILSV